ncbi:MAG: site-specific integrase [Candidatus Omnitrophica bacterium]|nr:site-specific integrase [Candidatus Omnitrophota bacterium]
MNKFMQEHSPTQEQSTQVRYRCSLKHLHQYFSGMLLTNVTARVVSDYIEKRKSEGAANATINREFAMLSKACSLAWKRWEWVKENPCNKISRLPEHNKIERYLTAEEEVRLLKQSEGYLNGDLEDIVTLALNTGMRQGEILNLKWKDVDFFRKTLTVVKTKNKEVKTIPMTDTTFKVLFEKSKVITMSGYIFATTNDTPIRARNLMREWYKVLNKAGIEDFRFHDLRHTAGTRLAQAGVDIYTISKILGHRDIRTTMRYAHHNPESLRASVKVLDNFTDKMVNIEQAGRVKNGSQQG